VRLASLILLVSAISFAQDGDKELAKQRYKTGQALFQRGRVAEALHEFEEGQRSFALPEFDYNIGLCLAKLDRPAEAADALQRYMDARPEDPDATGIWKMIAELRAVKKRQEPRAVEPPPTPQPEVIVKPQPVLAKIEPGKEKRRSLQLKLGIAAATIGGVSLVMAIFTGVSALSNRTDYDRGCGMGKCDDGLYVSARRLANATDFLIPFGAALVVTSIVLFATRPKLPQRAAELDLFRSRLAWRVAF
jgi:tetratricopeptide (TPR) repeat protein